MTARKDPPGSAPEPESPGRKKATNVQYIRGLKTLLQIQDPYASIL